MKIIGYYHICAINNYVEIVTEQVSALKSSGLLAATDHVNVSIVGPKDNVISLLKDPKFILKFESSTLDVYERSILNIMREDSIKANSSGEEFLIWYIHSKGVSTRHQNPISTKRMRDWRKLLEAFVIWNWEACCYKLYYENYETVGANYFMTPPHYSGNFWWSRSKYISRLRELPSKGDYIEPEMWLCKSRPKSYSFYNTDPRVWCYDKNYVMPNLRALGLKHHN